MTPSLCEKCPKTEFFPVRIFPHLGWIRTDTPYLFRIQSECGKIRIRKNSVFGLFSRSPYLVYFFILIISILQLVSEKIVIYKGVFRTKSNIYDGGFLQK